MARAEKHSAASTRARTGKRRTTWLQSNPLACARLLLFMPHLYGHRRASLWPIFMAIGGHQASAVSPPASSGRPEAPNVGGHGHPGARLGHQPSITSGVGPCSALRTFATWDAIASG